MLLTDAVISLICHLHYGLHNPNASTKQIDAKPTTGFSVDSVLKRSSREPFLETVLSSQPTNRQYRLLQSHLKLATGQYSGDCYQFSENSLKKVALNMERYKWEPPMPATYLEVNIPSYTLIFINGKLRNNFKVFVGKISSPTPVLNSEITSLKTNSDAILESKNIKKELLPTMFRNPEYLIRNHFDIFKNNGKYTMISSLLCGFRICAIRLLNSGERCWIKIYDTPSIGV